MRPLARFDSPKPALAEPAQKAGTEGASRL
jgi:hypothetical protein